MPSRISIIILTYNESLHLGRCLESVSGLSDDIHVVDSFSTDDTAAIAERFGARFVQHPFVHHARQFQWAMDHCPLRYEWCMRLDADEYLEAPLVREIQERLPALPEEVTGVYLKRKVYFKGKWIRHGGFYPHILLRLWRKGAAGMEQRWMDEHMVLTRGASVVFREDFVDYNLNGIHWWISKHNNYATREMIELLNIKYHFLPGDDRLLATPGQARRKRWLKERVYAALSPGLRAFGYFCYRYVFRFGFLDGYYGFIFHFMQGFWYRLLVDVNLMEAEQKIGEDRRKEHILDILRTDYKAPV